MIRSLNPFLSSLAAMALPVSGLAAEGGTWRAVFHDTEKRVELEVHARR